MTQYRPENIASNISPIDTIRRLYSRGEKTPDGAALVMRLVYDLCLTGALPVVVEQVENWWLVVSDKDWLVSPEGTPSTTNFSNIVPFPIAGDNSHHAEILITAFSNAAVTIGIDGIFWICGDHDWWALPDRLRDRLSRLERGRGVAFSIGSRNAMVDANSASPIRAEARATARAQTRAAPPRERADIAGTSAMPPPRRTDAPSVSPARQAGRGRDGWLSDLLARASQDRDDPGGGRAGWLSDPLSRASQDRDDPGRRSGPPPRDPDAGTPHSFESLDSLAIDIVRMIDHDAAAGQWDHKRGERNVFTHKLSTMQGQQAFEEIRRRYRSDRDFMRTVDRYIGEFERLFVEVSRADRGQVVARTYLNSEVGELYTVLAHAVGRFD